MYMYASYPLQYMCNAFHVGVCMNACGETSEELAMRIFSID